MEGKTRALRQELISRLVVVHPPVTRYHLPPARGIMVFKQRCIIDCIHLYIQSQPSLSRSWLRVRISLLQQHLSTSSGISCRQSLLQLSAHRHEHLMKSVHISEKIVTSKNCPAEAGEPDSRERTTALCNAVFDHGELQFVS